MIPVYGLIKTGEKCAQGQYESNKSYDFWLFSGLLRKHYWGGGGNMSEHLQITQFFIHQEVECMHLNGRNRPGKQKYSQF